MEKSFSGINNNFVSFSNANIFKEIKLIKKVQKLAHVKSKEDLHNLQYKGIKVGDLI